MKPVYKVLLGGCIVMIVVIIGVAIFAVRMFQTNKGKLRAKADEVRTEAMQFGRTATEEQCVAEAFNRYRSDQSLMSEVRARLWLAGCLETSRRDPAFCEAVPPTGEILRTVTWRLAECSRRGFEADKGCTRMLTEIQNHCHRRAGSRPTG